MNTDHNKAEAADEALALRHILHLHPDRREDALAELVALHLVGLHGAVGEALAETPSIGLADVLAMLERPHLKTDAELARPHLEPAGVDPTEAAEAYDRAVGAAKEKAQERRRLDAAAALERAGRETEADEKERHLSTALEHLHPARKLDREPLAALWERHRPLMFSKDEAGPMDAIKLDPRRGGWAGWFNAWMGPRGGLEPGRTLLLGGGPGGGKTSLAAALAVDAMAAGCPVLFWQLELSRTETLEHLMSQRPGAGEWWKDAYRRRANEALPQQWAALLDIPRTDDLAANCAETIRGALRNMARRAAPMPHACKGLVVVDYAQLLTVADKGPRDAGHEVLTTAASLLAKAAAEADACLVLLSQLTKESRKAGGADDTGFSGADLARMAHAAAVVTKDPDDHHARHVYWTKDRGRLETPGREMVLRLENRALVDAGGNQTNDYCGI